MKITLIILAIIVFLIALLLFIGINICFDLGYKKGQVVAKLRLYVLCHAFGKTFDFSDDEAEEDEQEEEEGKEENQEEQGSDEDSKEDSEPHSEQQGDKEWDDDHPIRSFFRKIKKKVRKVLNYKNAFLISREKIRRKFIFKKLDIDVVYGNGDAHKTAVTTGAVWALIYNIIGFISRTAVIAEHSERVNPEFNKKAFSLSLSGIFKTRLVHIIYAILLIRHNYKKISKRQEIPDEK